MKAPLIIFLSFLGIAILSFIIYYFTGKESDKALDNSVKQTSGVIKEEHENTRSVIEAANEKVLKEFKDQLDLKENAEEFLRLLLGENYKELILDEETRDQLKIELKNNSVYDVLNENRLFKKRVSTIEGIKNSTTKKILLDLLSSFKYESVRDIIDSYLKENKNLKPEQLAEMYFLKSLTYLGLGADGNKKFRKELVLKAYGLDENNPLIVFSYGSILDGEGKIHEANDVLLDALKLVENGKKIEAGWLFDLYQTLGNVKVNLEVDKSSEIHQDFDAQKKYYQAALDLASEKNSTDFPIHRALNGLAQTAILEGNYLEARTILKEANQYLEKVIGKDIVLIDNAVLDITLGRCYASMLAKNLKDHENGLINETAFTKLANENYKNGHSAFKSAAKVYLVFNQENNLYGSRLWVHIGNLEKYMNFDKAISAFEEARIIAESNKERLPYLSGNIYYSLANLYYVKKNTKQAKENAQKALNYYREVFPETHSKILECKKLISFNSY